MRDYAKTVARLRECISRDFGDCMKCGACSAGVCSETMDSRMTDAADAIEELLQKTQQLEDQLRAQPKMESRWISVEKRLPEDGEDVLCYYEYFRYGSFNRMYKTIDRGYFLNGHFGGEPTNGTKARVLYWMPLPEPPEEEKP